LRAAAPPVWWARPWRVGGGYARRRAQGVGDEIGRGDNRQRGLRQDGGARGLRRIDDQHRLDGGRDGSKRFLDIAKQRIDAAAGGRGKRREAVEQAGRLRGPCCGIAEQDAVDHQAQILRQQRFQRELNIGEPLASPRVRAVIAAAFFGFRVSEPKIIAPTGMLPASATKPPLGVGVCVGVRATLPSMNDQAKP